jgi:hypothetical protein
MKIKTERRFWIALLPVLVLFAGCKGDTPTAPPPGGGNNGGGGTTPPVGVTLTLTASNTDPLVDSSVVVTANVTQGGAAVPNGTAVEFVASGGTLDGGATATIKTTTGGVATVTLTSSAPGAISVQAAVNNVSKTVSVTFRDKPIVEPPPSTTPIISSITPAIGRPSGGEVVRIVGKNFKSPVKVLFDTGGASPVEAFVSSVSDTLVEAITPAINLGAGQQLVADVILLNQAGTSAEQRVEVTEGFTFRNEQLTPHISTASPNSGPVTGGTRVTIFGDGFQAPVQVLFGAAEARVIDVKYAEIIVEAPAGRDTSDNGSGTVTGPVNITVRNINSQTSASLTGGFRYVAAIEIITISPNEGSYTGGTRVTIDGNGFIAPVAISIGGVAAQPISVSGTRIIALTSPVHVVSCGDSSGPTIVTNVVNGDQATGPTFTYRMPKPLISNISPSSIVAGGSVTITVMNAQPGVTRFKLGDRELFPTGSVIGSDGVGTFTVAVPSNFKFDTEACTTGGITGEREVPTTVDVTYSNLETTCTNTLADGLEIQPTDTSCVLPPPADVTVTSPISPACATVGPITVGSSGTTQISFRNDGGQPLTIVQTGETGDASNEFSYSPAAGLSILPGQTGTFTVTYTPVDPADTDNATVTFTTNDPDPAEGSISICVSGSSS